MDRLRIYVDFAAPADAMDLLRSGASAHDLIFPLKPAASVLGKGEPDPRFAAADVAFGQPDTQAIADAPALKWVHISSSGITRYDNPPFRALMAERKIAVSNSTSVFYEACAVHALSFMLAQARKLPLALQTRTPGGSDTWNAVRAASRTLRGETVLILGFGAIGRRLADLLRPFHMNVLAYRRKPRGDEAVPIVAPADFPRVAALADHVVNLLPDSPETRLFCNRAWFASMKPGSVFYNIGRGTTVDQDALLDALRSGRLAAAWLDVAEPEPLPGNHPLLSQPNCFMTPHVAGGQFEESKALVRHFLANLERFIQDAPLADRVM